MGKPAAEGAEGSERAVGPYQVEQNQGQEVAALRSDTSLPCISQGAFTLIQTAITYT